MHSDESRKYSISDLLNSPILRHSWQQSHDNGLYYGLRDATLSREIQNTHARKGATTYSLARGVAVAVTGESERRQRALWHEEREGDGSLSGRERKHRNSC